MRGQSMPLEQPPPLAVRLAPSDGLDLAPVSALAGPIRCRPPLGYDALEPHPLCRLEKFHAIIEGFDQVQA